MFSYLLYSEEGNEILPNPSSSDKDLGRVFTCVLRGLEGRGVGAAIGGQWKAAIPNNENMLHMPQRYRRARQIQYTPPWGNKLDPSSGQKMNAISGGETISRRVVRASEGRGVVVEGS